MSKGRTFAQTLGRAISSGSITSTGSISGAGGDAQYSVSSATAVTVNTSTPTAICSTSITVTDRPILLVATGDANPNQSGGWQYYQIYRDSTAIGKKIINENGGGTSKNCPWALTHIDAPSAGTYTYTVKAYQGSGSMTYGETGDVQAPTITAVEII